MCDLTPIDPQVTLTPGRRFGFQTVFAQNCDKLLNSGAYFPAANALFVFQSSISVVLAESMPSWLPPARTLVAACRTCIDLIKPGIVSRVQ